MEDSSLMIMSVSSMDDIEKLKEMKSVKYINLDITNPNLEVIYYFIDNGEGYSYSDMIDGKRGYIYVSYDVFRQSELFILDLVGSVNTDFNEIEISKYLYIQLGKCLGYDINILPDKNETFNLQNINTINNIWGCVYNLKGSNISFCKLYLYLCRLLKIDCRLVTVSQTGYLRNVLNIGSSNIPVDVTADLPFIQSNFQTRYFLGYNNDICLDKKIGYIKDNYSEFKLQTALRGIDFSRDDFFWKVLMVSQSVINVSDIKPIELGIIYNIIFSNYCPDCDIVINNLFINDLYNSREHFILISFDNKYYSYNYKRNSFVEISYDEIKKNIDNNRIGIYMNEKVPMINVNKEKVIL